VDGCQAENVAPDTSGSHRARDPCLTCADLTSARPKPDLRQTT